MVTAATKIVNEVVIPQLNEKYTLDMAQREERMRTEIKEDMKNEVEEEITAKFQSQINNLKMEVSELKLALENKIDAKCNTDAIVSASATIVNDIIFPQIDRQLTTKVGEMKQEVTHQLDEAQQQIRSGLKIEFDEDFSTSKDELKLNLEEQIVTRFETEQQNLEQTLQDQINDKDDKVIFAAVRKSGDIKKGQTITYDTMIANYGDTMDGENGLFTAKKSGLYMFTFSTVTSGTEGRVKINILVNGANKFVIDDAENGSGEGLKGQRNISYSWMLVMAQDDTISMNIYNGNKEWVGLHVCSEDWIHFTGQLLKHT